MVDVQPAADHLLRGIVGTTRILAAEQDPADQLLLRNMDIHHDIDLQALLGQDLVELLGLHRRAGESVEDAALGILVLGDVVGDHADDDLIGCQLALLDILFHAAAQLRTAADLVTDHLARRDVVDAVMFLQTLRLRTFSAARSTE